MTEIYHSTYQRLFWLALASVLFVRCSFAQINCPPHLPLSLIGNTSYCIGTPGSQLSVEQSYTGYEWLPTTETSQSVLLTAGNYQLVVTHYTGCTDTMDIVVQQVSNPPQPTIDVNGPTQFCEGGSVTLTVPTWYPYYEWSTGSVSDEITVYESGTYNVYIEDWIGCASSSNSIQIIVDPLPTAAFSPSLNAFDIEFNNFSLDATDYEWNFGDGATSTDFEPTHTYNIGGGVSMYLVASNSCGSDTAFLDLTSVSVENIENREELAVFPNPSSGIFELRSDAPLQEVQSVIVYDNLGREVESFQTNQLGSSGHKIDLTDKPVGIYSLIVEGESFRKSILLFKAN